MLAVRGSAGFYIVKDGTVPPPHERIYEPDCAESAGGDDAARPAPACRVMQFSPCGRYLAYCDTRATRLLELERAAAVLLDLPLGRTAFIDFSPSGNYVCLWQPYVVYGSNPDNREPDPNVRVYRVRDGHMIAVYVHKKPADWRPQWTSDERLCCRLIGSEIVFTSPDDFSKRVHKYVFKGVSDYCLSPGASSHLATFVPPLKGAPGALRVLRVGAEQGGQPLAQRTVMKADKMQLKWNSKGSALLALAMTDTDSTGKSYYGEQNLYFADMGGQSYTLQLEKRGPVYAFDWNPNGLQYCVVHGFMPAHAAVYNLKGDKVLDLGEGPRNEVRYNGCGNLLLVCGFGNLSGNMEFWSVEQKKTVNKMCVANTTQCSWSPCGQYLVTATCAPRLRIDNGYKVWKYTGQLISEYMCAKPTDKQKQMMQSGGAVASGEEMWQVQWRPAAVAHDFALDAEAGWGAAMSTSTASAKSASANANASANASANAAVHPVDRMQKAGAVNKSGAYVPPAMRSKAAAGALKSTGEQAKVSALSDVEKKRKTLQKKLDQIGMLKQRRDNGETLEVNQLDKINKEAELQCEMDKLSVAA